MLSPVCLKRVLRNSFSAPHPHLARWNHPIRTRWYFFWRFQKQNCGGGVWTCGFGFFLLTEPHRLLRVSEGPFQDEVARPSAPPFLHDSPNSDIEVYTIDYRHIWSQAGEGDLRMRNSIWLTFLNMDIFPKSFNFYPGQCQPKSWVGEISQRNDSLVLHLCLNHRKSVA